MAKKKNKNLNTETLALNEEAFVEQVLDIPAPVATESQELFEATHSEESSEASVQLIELSPEDGVLEVNAASADIELEGTTEEVIAEALASTEEDYLAAHPNLITDRQTIVLAVEALVFASPKAISLKRIKGILGSFNYDTRPVAEILETLINESAERGYQLVKVAGAYQFRSNPTQSDILQKLLEDKPVRLGGSALEVLAIIAYKQPVSRSEIDAVRGVDSGHLTRGLLDKNLIRTVGHAETPGRPLLYGTTPYFLEVFTLNSLDDMPSLEEFDRELVNKKNAVGLDSDDEESIGEVDAEALEQVALFHGETSHLAANPDRGAFDEPASDEESTPDFGIEERAREEV